MKRIFAFCTVFLMFNASIYPASAPDIRISDDQGHVLNINSDGTVPISGGGGGLTSSTSTNLSGFMTSSYPIATGWVKSLTATSGNTLAGGYDAITTGTADFGASGTEFHVFTYSHKNRIRQVGSLTQVKFYTVSVPAELTHFYIEVWREDSANANSFTRISQEDVLASIAATTTNTVTLASPVPVREGDFVGYGYTASSDPGNFLDSITGIAASSYTTTSTPSASAYAWKSKTAVTNILPMQLYVDTAPLIVFLGDSIISGQTGNRSFIEATDQTSLLTTMEYYVYQMLSAGGTISGITYQNMGIGGQTLSTIRARATADAVNLNPQIVVLDGGVNDINAGSTFWQIIKELEKTLVIFEAANIYTFVEAITPYEAGSAAQMRSIERYNYYGKKICEEQFQWCTWVDNTRVLGKFRAANDQGNLWDYNALTKDDGTHPNTAGYLEMAKNLVMAMTEASRNKPRGNAKWDNISWGKQTAGQMFTVLTDNRLSNMLITPPNVGASTTEADLSGSGNTMSYAGVTASQVRLKNRAWVIAGATSNTLTVADADSLSFGDSATDHAFSMTAFIEVTDQATEQTIFSKYNPATGVEKREYVFALDSTEKLRLDIWDETANVKCSRLSDAALSSGVGTFHTVTATYSGVGGGTAGNGIKLYVDGALVASTATNDASYVAMNNTTQAAGIGFQRNTSGSSTLFMLSDYGGLFVNGTELTAEQVHATNQILRSVYGE